MGKVFLYIFGTLLVMNAFLLLNSLCLAVHPDCCRSNQGMQRSALKKAHI